MLRRPVLPILLVSALAAATSCAPTVQIATEEPIVLNLNIRVEQEVRIKLDREVEELLGTERSKLSTRSADVNPDVLDSRGVSKAKRERVIGERADGYLGVIAAERVGVGSETRALVARVNEDRRREYVNLADRYGAARSDVEAIAGARRVELAAPGERVLRADGRWSAP